MEADLQAYKRILVPFDGSAGSTDALRRALMLAKEQGATVTAFSVNEAPPRYAPGVGEVGEEDALRSAYFAGLRDRALAIASEQGLAVTTEGAVGHAAQAIIAKAKEGGFDLIAIGHSGHSGLWGTLLGSTAARVVEHAPCDVLVVR